jgi:hypothetical protein
LSIGRSANDLVLSSQGVASPTPAEVDHFFAATWRYFETTDQAFEHPTAIQGNWKISGVGLSSRPLRKIYANNAERLLKIRLP